MTVTALYRYPVKSMLGEALTHTSIGARGIAGDRAYAVLDVETGAVASAKVPKRWAALLGFSAAFAAEPEPDAAPPPVVVTFPDGSVHRSDDEGVDAALSAVLGREVRLVSVAPEGAHFEELWPDIAGLAPQSVIDGTAVRREDTGEVVSRFDVPPGTFFDLAPLHVLTEDTLDHLRGLAPHATFDVRRYRPNIVLRSSSSTTAFAENAWPGTTVTVGDARIAYSLATMRCVMTTLPQGDLPADADTLRAIAKANRIDVPQVGGVWACAGVYADVAAPGSVRVGDAVRV